MKRVLAFLLISVLLIGLFSCRNKEEEPKEALIEISFNTSYLSVVAMTPESVSVKQGECVAQPQREIEVPAGYVLIWTKDPSTRTPYDFREAVQESFVLYAVEIPRTYSITYLLEHCTNTKKNPASFTKENDTITLRSPITDFGYIFEKWSYYDRPDSNVTEIPKGTEEDLVLRAVTRAVTYNVRYYDEGEVNPNPNEYLFGTTLVLKAPTKAGYRFLGYTVYSDKSGLEVTELTPTFGEENKDKPFKVLGIEIYLRANWEEETE